jgi:hypothetical protein
MPKRVYLAGPYSTGDKEANVRRAIAAADMLWAAGFSVFLPHLTHFWDMVSPHPYEDWISYDAEWLACCDCLVRLPGESAGADREESFARDHSIPVWHGAESFLSAMKDQRR